MDMEKAKQVQSLCNLLDKVTEIEDNIKAAYSCHRKVFLSFDGMKTLSLSWEETEFLTDALSHEIENILKPQIESI